MAQIIKVGFCAFGKDFNYKEFLPIKLLSDKYDFQLSDNPDYLFYTPADNTHHNFDCIRIFWTGENIIPNFNYCDYAIGFSTLSFDDRYMRLPLWTTYKTALEKAINRQNTITKEQALNRSFCATVISNSKQTDGVREKMFEILSSYKSVASGGKWKNSVGGPVPDKIEFQKNYKFCLCAENTYAPGYTTEKILEAFASNCIPIYYGDPLAVQDFNPKAFINAHDFPDMASLLERVKEIDSNDELYWQILQESPFLPNTLEKYSDEKVAEFFDHIFSQPYEKAKRRFYFKPYQDFDYRNLKVRDIKLILKHFFLSRFKRKSS